MKHPLLAPLAVVLLSGCGGAASVRQAAMAIADAPSLIAALIAYYSVGQNPLPNEFDDAVRECVDDLDNGSDAEEMFGEERLPCLCYDRIVDQVGGTLDSAAVHERLVGSIPAPAGEPAERCPAPSWRRVYPRAYGGTGPHAGHISLPRGLSPRLRGNPSRPRISTTRSGSIPAPAGEPSLFRSSPLPPRVYPRACGGTIGRESSMV